MPKTTKWILFYFVMLVMKNVSCQARLISVSYRFNKMPAFHAFKTLTVIFLKNDLWNKELVCNMKYIYIYIYIYIYTHIHTHTY
jgi:hypothetical protein